MVEPYRLNVGDFTVLMREKRDRIVAACRRGESYEPESLAWWTAACESDDRRPGVAIDVGAYTGVYSILAAIWRQVVAFEPMPANYMRCKENFALNEVADYITLFQACASDRCGDVPFMWNPRVIGMTAGASMIRPSGGTASLTRTVSAMTIDSLNLERCVAVKIDVERGEPAVLRGARQTLERCRPLLLVEVLGEAEGAAVLAAAPGYRRQAVLDGRNWLMVPE